MTDDHGSAKSVIHAAKGLGSDNVPVPPGVLSKIYWAVAIPKMLYGFEVLPLEESSEIRLEDAHRQNAKYIQGLPRNIHKPAPLATLGWLSIHVYIAIMKIMFIVRTLCLPCNNLFREVLVKRINYLSCDRNYKSEKIHGPVKNALQYFKKYDLMKILDKFKIAGNVQLVNETKIYVKKVIWNFETNRWKSSCMLYRELKLYMDGVMAIRMNVWWLLAKKRPHLTGKKSSVIAVLMSCQPKSLQCNHGHKLCRLCQIRVVENPVHTLLHCNRLCTVRTRLLENIIKGYACPYGRLCFKNE